uniref:Uncharacterized protein n=1 Tax=Rhizophora mucronata TaxID=61149 RepID=A0A2P2QUM9_RHIMU
MTYRNTAVENNPFAVAWCSWRSIQVGNPEESPCLPIFLAL